MKNYDMALMAVPLPDDVERLKESGYFKEAAHVINVLLSESLPACMKKRLELEKYIMKIMGENQYPYTEEEALKILHNSIADFKDEELSGLKDSLAADWIFMDGQIRFQRLFFDNIIKTRQDYADRMINKESDISAVKRREMLDDNVERMMQDGERKAEITIRASVKIKKEAEHPGEHILVHIPIPAACRQNSRIRILSCTPDMHTVITPEEVPQRTISFEGILKENQEFFVEYAYENHVVYVNPQPEKATFNVPEALKKQYCTERLPHIRFTPFMRELLREIAGDEKNPLIVARKIYDFITRQVKYSYVREYIALENISEYAAKNRKGDCGVQAILFITLCRLFGIPARWQSGLYASAEYTGCHDWAEFYAEPYGWLYADPSFGGSAWRTGNIKRWNYYFGNLDIFRMVANREIQSEFTPEKNCMRADPVDNQRGEIEYADEGLCFDQFEEMQKTISIVEC